MPNALMQADDVELSMMDEANFAEWQRELGMNAVEFRGRHWIEVSKGCFQPIHPLAQLRWSEIGRPSVRCLTFRSCLYPEDVAHANGSLPAMLLPDPQHYVIGRLSSKRQALIRRCLSRIDVVALRQPDIVIEQGFGLVEEVHRCNRVISRPEPNAFRRMIESYFQPRRGLILAALRGGTLLGFTVNHAVGRTAYADRGWVGSEGNRVDAWLGLSHSFLTIAKRCPEVEVIMNGLDLRERAGVSNFKRRLGFEVGLIPTYVWLAAGCSRLFRLVSSNKHYRWTGLV